MKTWPLSISLFFILNTSTLAVIVAPPPIPARVAVVDRVLVGKVTKVAALERDPRPARLATVAVTESVFGPEAKEVQVMFYPPVGRRTPGVELVVGDVALLYLTRHPSKKGVFVARMNYEVALKKDNPTFTAELGEAKKAAKRLADPKAALDAKDASDRLATAVLLITRYRSPRPGSTKTDPLPADESRSILTALASADWDAPRNRRLNPAAAFVSLGLSDIDGWKPPEDFGQFADAAKKWLRANAGTYHIQRYVWPEPEG